MAKIEISFQVNAVPVTVLSEPAKTLLRVLREDLGLTGSKEGCGQGDCGTCVVLMDGEPVNACLVLAAQTVDADIVTVEGLEKDGMLHPIQQHFTREWGFQCGYCTPGMLMSCAALLDRNTDPSVQEIKEAIEGNLCRCTNYRAIIDAVAAAATDLRSRVQAQES